MGGRAQVADASIGGQRTDVQQNSGGTLETPNYRRLAAALFENLVAGLVEVLGDLVRGGLLLVDNLGHHAGSLRVDGSADVAHREVEELRSYLADLAESGTWPLSPPGRWS
jgi:hypothetical protein